VLVFAHNGHVANSTNSGSVWDALAKPPKMVGVHLRSMFGRRLVIIGQSGGASADTAVHVVPDTAGIDEALASVGLRQFALDLRTTRVGTPERHWLETARPLRANLSLHQVVRPIEAFDVLVYADTLRPAIAAKRGP
jgi:erythromycin esterase-like protein